ncbi:MAG: hypothetical protein WA182_19505 [Candidatus Sulfotelmatobacter sp.]
MSNQVWSLSVDLQTKTATFSTGLADAARNARSSFAEIKDGAREMSSVTGSSATEARHSVMMLGEEFGVHLPRGVTMFISSLGPVQAAMSAAFPLLAIAAGATILIEKLMKMSDEAAKSGQAWKGITDDIAKWGETSKEELLDVQIQLDKLSGDKLKELQDTLKKIDLTTMDHLKGEFDSVGKKVDEQFTKMRSGWLMTQLGMGNGVADVQQMFGSAMDKINADLAKGDQKKLAADLKEAGDQMWNMAAPTYNLVQRLQEAHNEWGANKIAADGHYQALLKAHGVLESMTQELVQQQKIEKDKDTVATKTITPVHDATDPRIASELKKQLASYLETNKQKAESEQKLDEQRMDLEASVTRYFAEQNKKRTEDDFRAAEQQHDAAAKANDESMKSAEALRKIHETQTVSAASAYLISKQEEQARLRKILQQEQTDLTAAHQREIAEQQAFASQMSAIAANSSGEARTKALADAANAQTQLTAATRQYNQEMARTSAAIQASDMETAKLNNSWRLFFMESNKDLLSLTSMLNGQVQTAMKQVTDGFAQGVAKAAVEGKSFGKSMADVAKQMSESMIEGLIKWGMQDLITKMGMKATASSLAGANAVASMAAAPWPVDMSAPAFGASMMASSLAMEAGGIVPGVGRGDIVPAMLEPGEGVLSNRAMDNLKNTSRGGGSGVTHVHNNTFAPVIHAVDSDGVDRMLTEHHQVFKKHLESHARRMNS